MKRYCVEVVKEDAGTLPVTNIGAWTTDSLDADHFVMCTYNKSAFDTWINALKESGRQFRILNSFP